jgi:hypothetical protein
MHDGLNWLTRHDSGRVVTDKLVPHDCDPTCHGYDQPVIAVTDLS